MIINQCQACNNLGHFRKITVKKQATEEQNLPLKTEPLRIDAADTITHEVAGLFAGIGGLELGFSRAGHSTQLLCEIDPSANAVLQHHPDFHASQMTRNICRLEGQDLRGVSLIAAGFPCQDLSQAGRTQGLDGKNSGLIGEVFRLLREKDVPEVLLENVPFMMQLSRGAALERILTEFERMGYSWAYRVIDALAFGLPQRRQRIFIVASKIRDPRTILLGGPLSPTSEPREWNPKNQAVGFYWTEGTRGIGWAVDCIPTLKGGSSVGIPSPPAILLPDGRVVTPTLEAAERLQGFRAGWTQPAEIVDRASFRWKLVGNAVNVRVSRWIGERLAQPKAFVSHSYRPIGTNEKWPRAAWCVDGKRRWTDDAIGTHPVRRKATPLADFLGDQVKPLSEKALAGFVSRLEKSTLRTPQEFRDSLHSALENYEMNTSK